MLSKNNNKKKFLFDFTGTQDERSQWKLVVITDELQNFLAPLKHIGTFQWFMMDQDFTPAQQGEMQKAEMAELLQSTFQKVIFLLLLIPLIMHNYFGNANSPQ